VKTLKVKLGTRSYPILIGSGLLTTTELFDSTLKATQLLVITNDTVGPLYLDRLLARLGNRQIETVVLPDGEAHKTLASFNLIIDRLLAARFHRDACILALGGGVVGDVAGFAAASFQRGIDYIQIPTTILAQVDSSVGGKTAVNHPRAKNMIGAFHQPIAVLSDLDTLATLPRREFAAGLAEVIKYGLIVDLEFLDWIDENLERLLALDGAVLEHAIARSCELKAQIVAEDEREQGRRALLNLGHSFGHALESIAGYGRWLHGEAVAIGTVMAARLSHALGMLEQPDVLRLEELLQRAGLPLRAEGVSAAALLETMQLDKKADRDGLRLVLLNALGRASLQQAPAQALLLETIERCLSNNVRT
jgi:3-dehydroquinate synthase